MPKRLKLSSAVLAFAAITICTLWLLQAPSPVGQAVAPRPSAPAPSAATPLDSLNPFAHYQQISLKTMSRKDAVKLYVQRFNQDSGADWKVALNFYGKVVDENQEPVAGATASCEWNTLGGTSKATILSDGSGLFSLTGKQGKILEIRVEKNGYHTVDGGQGALAFEYANPAESDYYEPDRSQPVMFHLRKKGMGAQLVNKNIDLILDVDHPANNVNLMTGLIKSDGTFTVRANKPDYRQARGRFSWSISLNLTEGGLVETTDPFPFQAPDGGYNSSAIMDMLDTDSPAWSNSQTKTYYFNLPSSNTYGRMKVDTLGASRHVIIEYSYNPTPGQRNLEPPQQ